MSAADKTLIRNVGPSTIKIDGIDIGLVHVEGLKVTQVGGVVKAHSSRSGPHVAEVAHHEGHGCQFELLFMQTEFDILEQAIPAWSRVSGGGKEKLVLGRTPGEPVPSYQLTVVSTIAAQTPISDFQINEAIFDSEPPLQFWGGNQFFWLVKGEGLLDSTGVVAVFGDASTVQGVAAAVSAVVPANAAAGQAVGTNVTATITKDLNRGTLNAGNVRLYKNVAGNLTEVPGAISGVNAGAATTIVFNPTANLDALSQYVFILGSLASQFDIYDADGNQMTHFDSEFTTA